MGVSEIVSTLTQIVLHGNQIESSIDKCFQNINLRWLENRGPSREPRDISKHHICSMGKQIGNGLILSTFLTINVKICMPLM
jgi:hypothetical protein